MEILEVQKIVMHTVWGLMYYALNSEIIHLAKVATLSFKKGLT